MNVQRYVRSDTTLSHVLEIIGDKLIPLHSVDYATATLFNKFTLYLRYNLFLDTTYNNRKVNLALELAGERDRLQR